MLYCSVQHYTATTSCKLKTTYAWGVKKPTYATVWERVLVKVILPVHRTGDLQFWGWEKGYRKARSGSRDKPWQPFVRSKVESW